MRLHRLLILLACGAPSLRAQDTLWYRLEAIGGDADDRRRLAQLLGERPMAGYQLRSPSTMTGWSPAADRRLRWSLVMPELTAVGNSSVPFSLNDGALWAGRGWSQDVRFGLRAQRGRVVLVLAPEFVGGENLGYELPPLAVQLPRPPGRDALSTPWYVGAYSIDQPLRFGTWGFRRLDPGQSTLAADLGTVTVGLSTENEWWGPGIRNAIVLSNNAAGIPRAFVRTSRPLRTRVGSFEARWFLGGLFESPYFDRTPADDRRSITALAATWTPAAAPDLTLGFTRAVYAPLARWGDIFQHLVDVVRDRGQHQVPGRPGPQPRRDQIFSLFGRWVFPADGFAVHAEWARTEPPRSLRDLLTNPNHSQGYTLGLEWARRLGAEGSLRLQAEATYLELPPSFRNEPEATFYTGLATPQGYTQRGEVLGAAIGPGASSQWVGLDYFRPRWRLGLSAGRIRWNDDALYLFPITAIAGNKWCSHDVSLFWGVSAAADHRWGRVRLAVTRAERLNVFFHYLTTCDLHPDPQYILDARNTTIEIRLSPP